MSIDIVDDLHAAEDYANTLRSAARRVVDTWETGDLAEAVRYLDAMTATPFQRPSCEQDPDKGYCTQGEDCGGYHPWGGGR